MKQKRDSIIENQHEYDMKSINPKSELASNDHSFLNDMHHMSFFEKDKEKKTLLDRIPSNNIHNLTMNS